MNSSDRSLPHLLPLAAGVSLLVLLLAATGLCSLSYTNTKSAAALERLRAMNVAQVAAVEAQVSFKTQVQEWKNILLRGRNPADYKVYRERFELSEGLVRADLESARNEMARLGLDASAAVRLLADHAALGSSYRKALAGFQPADPFATDAAVRGIDRKLNEGIDALAGSVNAEAAAEIRRFGAAGTERYGVLRKVTFALGGFTMLAAFWLVLKASRREAR